MGTVGHLCYFASTCLNSFYLSLLPSVSLCSEQCWGSRAGAAEQLVLHWLLWANCSHISPVRCCSELLTAGHSCPRDTGIGRAWRNLNSLCHWLHTVKDTLLFWLSDSCCHCSAIWLGSEVIFGLVLKHWILSLASSIQFVFSFFCQEKIPVLLRNSRMEITLVSFFFSFYCVLESKFRNSGTRPLMWFAICLPIWGLTLPLWQTTLVNVMCSSG